MNYVQIQRTDHNVLLHIVFVCHDLKQEFDHFLSHYHVNVYFIICQIYLKCHLNNKRDHVRVNRVDKKETKSY